MATRNRKFLLKLLTAVTKSPSNTRCKNPRAKLVAGCSLRTQRDTTKDGTRNGTQTRKTRTKQQTLGHRTGNSRDHDL
jgi:hypothetical protein